MLRTLAIVAALVALAAFGAAIGDFASDPNPLGAVGLLAVAAAIVLAFSRLFGRGGVAALWPGPRPQPAPRVEARHEPEPAPEAPKPRRRQPRTRPTSAPLWLDDDDAPR